MNREEILKNKHNLQNADLQGADLQDADFQDANLQGADLRGADLRGADLRGAYLRFANLRNTDLRNTNLKIFQSYLWTAYITPNTTHIGCQTFTNEQWKSFTDEEIAKLHHEALNYWNQNKSIIFAIMNSFNP